MARDGTKSGGKDFVKGDPRTKFGGRKKLPEDLKAVKKLSNDMVQRLLAKYCYMTREEIVKVAEDPATSALDLIVCKIIVKAVKDGDQKRLDFLFDRTIGKVLQQMQVDMPKPIIIRRRNGEQVVLKTDAEDENDGDR